MEQALNVGDQAPPFEVEAIGGQYGKGTKVRLSDFAGGSVVLYFYPKDDTPGCTVQACGVRDIWQALSAKAAIFGVSIDNAASHQKFQAKFELPFPLLSDPDHRLAEAYGVWVEKSMYGKKYMGTERSTFVIGPDGLLRAVFRKVKPDEHAQLLLKALE